MNSTINKLIVFFLLAMPLGQVSAQSIPLNLNSYLSVGIVNQVKGDIITVSDNAHKLSPTVKISLPDNREAQLTDIGPGDMVSLSFIVINKRTLVDKIVIMPKQMNLPTLGTQ